MAEVKVIGSSIGVSLFCYRVEWALKLKGVEHELIAEDLRNKSPMLLKYNPVHKKVPVLVHNGKPIAESLVILDYIEDTWKENPILPENPYDRAMARFWGKFADEKCLTEVWTAFCTEGHGQEKAVESAIETLRILDKQVKGKKFFGGETIGFLDLVVGWIPHWLAAFEKVGGMKILDAETLPSLHEWADNFIQIPMIKESLPPMEKVINYFQGSRKYMLSLAADKK